MTNASAQKINELEEGGYVDATFVALRQDIRKAKNGMDFATMTLRDETGEIKLIKFNFDPRQKSEFDRCNGVAVRGRIEKFNNRLQIKADALEPATLSDKAVEDVLPSTSYDVDELEAELRGMFEAMGNPWLRTLMLQFLDDESFAPRLKRAPASMFMHHPFKGGLLEHIVSVANLALNVCKHYQQVDADVLLAGVFLHDIGKVEELSLDTEINYTDVGTLLGHITIGIEMIEARCSTIPDFPGELKMILKHLVLSHHGRLEYGSPKLPATLEAIMLHYVDNMDAKVWGFEHAVSQSADEAHFTEYVRMFEGRLYKFPLDPASVAKDDV